MKNNNFNTMRSDYPPLPTLPMPTSRADPSKRLIVAELLKEPGNELCADCSAAINMENAWAVLSYGILVCDDCKLVHIEHQNHYKSPDVNDTSADASTSGILSTQFAHVWEEKDVAQIKNNGNKKTNATLLKNSPVWQYRPSANDGIKLKEHWIKCKYSGNAGEAAENPAKMASKKQFIGYQFIRPTPKGETYHCCVVIQNDTLYLTSDKGNEEIPVECIETVVVNSKRIGHENGLQLTYRVSSGKDGNTVAFTYLQHDTMVTVMNWVNLVLYTKYTVLKRKYPTMIDENIAKILNCGMVKESYMHVTGKGLIYLSLSEARLTCFQHHLDDVPLFQIAVSSVMNLTASQYLDAVACFFDIEANKILSYGDWFNALEFVLKTDKIGAMPDDVPKPTFPFSLLKKPETPSAPVETSEPAPPKDKLLPVSIASPTTNSTPLNNNPPPKNDADKDGEKKPGSYECYPPIGPMGEMGKVFRGELPPDAIKPPPPKNDISRIGIFGEYLPQIPAAHVQLPIKSSYSDLMNQGLATTLNPATNPAIMNPAMPKDAMSCYPPIGGPPQSRKIRCDLSTLTNTQVAQLRKQEALEELRGGSASMTHSSILLSQLAQKQQSLFDQARIPSNLISGGRFADADPQLAAQAINFSQYPGWGDASTENILTMPWKNTSNGYEPARALSTASAQDMWNVAAATKMQTLNGDRSLLASQQGKGLPFTSWNARSPSVDLSQQTPGLARNQTWGSGMSSAGIDQWPNKSPTSPIDAFMAPNNRDVRGPVPTGMFGAAGSGNRGLVLNGKMGQRTESPGSSSSNQQNMIIDNLLRQWKSAEQRLLGLIHNSYVPASDMSPAGLDKDSAEHAYTCVSELFELLWKQRYDLALSFLRGFREVFANSIHSEIRNLFIGVGELDTMKQIFLQQGKEKFFSGSSGGPVTWKSPTTPQPAQSSPFDSGWQSSSAASSILSGESSTTDFSPWGNVVTPSSSMTPDPWSLSTRSSTRSTSMSSDPWNTSTSIFNNPTSSIAGPSFNRAPSRPSQTHAPSFGDHSPTGSAFGSKTSSDSQSPRVVTPPTTTYEPLNAAVFSGLESTLKNILLNENN